MLYPFSLPRRYDELTNTIRQTLFKGQDVLATNTIKGLWCALDADCSNSVDKEEAGAFLRRGTPALPDVAPPPQRVIGKLTGPLERRGMGRAIDSTPTAVMLEELKAAGIELPTDEEIMKLSEKICLWLAEYRRQVLCQESEPSWYNLYALLDQDGSGFITFDELTNAIRQKLFKGPKVVATNTIKALWCALDADCSNSVDKEEAGAFLRLGTPALPKAKPPPQKVIGKLSGPLERRGMNRAVDSTPTARMLEELKTAGVSLPDEGELKAISLKLCSWLAEYRRAILNQESRASWFNLYAIIDIDGSGFITYDELYNTIRQSLFKGPRILPTNAIKALWCALDADCSNSVDKEEAGAFLRLGVAQLPTPKPQPAKEFSTNILYGPMGRVGMNRAIDSPPTTLMLEQLKAAGVGLPSDEQITTLSKRLCEWLADYRRQVLNQESAPSWYNLYAIIDIDGSGFITYDELFNTIRQSLFKGPRILPTNAIKALWCALDADCSNSVDKEEAGAFLRRGVALLPKPQAPPVKEFSSSNLVGPIGRIGMGRAIDSTPTAQMLKELNAAGVLLPTQEELKKISFKLCSWLAEYRRQVLTQESAPSWFNLYAIIDIDGSGFITYDELYNTIRQSLFKGPRDLPTNAIKALWCALDADCSNSVDKEEAGAFLRLGVAQLPKPQPPPVKDFSTNILYGPMGRVGMGRPIDSPPTIVMLDQLKAAGVPLPNEVELTALSEKLNQWIADYRRQVLNMESKPSWFNVYAVIDQDGSGFITYDELQNTIRQTLLKGPNVMSTNVIRALWCALDAARCNMLQKEEMGAFLRLASMHRRQPSTKKVMEADKPPPMPWLKKSAPATHEPPNKEDGRTTEPTKRRVYAYDQKSDRWKLQEAAGVAAGDGNPGAALKADSDSLAAHGLPDDFYVDLGLVKVGPVAWEMMPRPSSAHLTNTEYSKAEGTRGAKVKKTGSRRKRTKELAADGAEVFGPKISDAQTIESETAHGGRAGVASTPVEQQLMDLEEDRRERARIEWESRQRFLGSATREDEVEKWAEVLQSWQEACAAQLEGRVSAQLSGMSGAIQHAERRYTSACSASVLSSAAIINPPPPAVRSAPRRGRSTGKADGKYDGKGGVFLRPASFDNFFRPSSSTSSRVAMGQSRSAARLTGSNLHPTKSAGQLSAASQMSELRPRNIQFGHQPSGNMHPAIHPRDLANAAAAARMMDAGEPGADLRSWDYRPPPERRQAGEPGGSLDAHVPFWQRTMPPPSARTRNRIRLTKPKRVLLYNGGGQQTERLIWPDGM